MLKFAMLGLIASLVSLAGCIIFTPIYDVFKPGTEWHFGGVNYGYSGAIFINVSIMGIPGFIGGILIKRWVKYDSISIGRTRLDPKIKPKLQPGSKFNIVLGLVGIALGVYLHVYHMLYGLVGDGIFAGLCILLFPIICSQFLLVSLGNDVGSGSTRNGVF